MDLLSASVCSSIQLYLAILFDSLQIAASVQAELTSVSLQASIVRQAYFLVYECLWQTQMPCTYIRSTVICLPTFVVCLRVFGEDFVLSSAI